MTTSSGDSTPHSPPPTRAVPDSALEQKLRDRIETLAYLPTTVAVAMKFIQLNKDPEAEPEDYCSAIRSDSALSAKLLSLANSSWFGVRHKVTKVNMAVNLLGLGTVRTLTMSFCVTGLHNELGLTSEEASRFWTASLCKAVAARQFILPREPKLAEEAFAAGLFQDMALPVMYAVAPTQVLDILGDTTLDVTQRLQRERSLFRLDHTELGRNVAQKLELPDLFIDTVAFHHNRTTMREFVEKPALADACWLASLFPHQLDAWNADDARLFTELLAEYGHASADDFLGQVQAEFNRIYAFFVPDGSEAVQLQSLLATACREVADNTHRLVGTMHEMLQTAAADQRMVSALMHRKSEAEHAAKHDPLTGAMSRDGFEGQAAQLHARAARYSVGFAVAYLDVDQFKQLNDTKGHAAGDEALRKLVTTIQRYLRSSDLVGRLGGDEFALFFNDYGQDESQHALATILAALQSSAAAGGPGPSVSAGLLWVAPRRDQIPMDQLLHAADQLMYQAKRAGGNRFRFATTLSGQTQAA